MFRTLIAVLREPLLLLLAAAAALYLVLGDPGEALIEVVPIEPDQLSA